MVRMKLLLKSSNLENHFLPLKSQSNPGLGLGVSFAFKNRSFWDSNFHKQNTSAPIFERYENPNFDMCIFRFCNVRLGQITELGCKYFMELAQEARDLSV